jgi:hypothetical protein
MRTAGDTGPLNRAIGSVGAEFAGYDINRRTQNASALALSLFQGPT